VGNKLCGFEVYKLEIGILGSGFEVRVLEIGI
jgi:hypothetical protein